MTLTGILWCFLPRNWCWASYSSRELWPSNGYFSPTRLWHVPSPYWADWSIWQTRSCNQHDWWATVTKHVAANRASLWSVAFLKYIVHCVKKMLKNVCTVVFVNLSVKFYSHYTCLLVGFCHFYHIILIRSSDTWLSSWTLSSLEENFCSLGRLFFEELVTYWNLPVCFSKCWSCFRLRSTFEASRY